MSHQYVDGIPMSEVSRMSRESIYDVLYWEMTNLAQHIKDTHPNHNSIPQIDKVICMIIDARKILMELEQE